MRAWLPSLLVVGLCAGAAPRRPRPSRAVSTPKEAREIAERETGGRAVSARKIPLNGATGGWEVEVRMPREDQGWLCTIDSDTHAVHRRTRIPNPPPAPGKR